MHRVCMRATATKSPSHHFCRMSLFSLSFRIILIVAMRFSEFSSAVWGTIIHALLQPPSNGFIPPPCTATTFWTTHARWFPFLLDVYGSKHRFVFYLAHTPFVSPPVDYSFYLWALLLITSFLAHSSIESSNAPSPRSLPVSTFFSMPIISEALSHEVPCLPNLAARRHARLTYCSLTGAYV